MVSSIVFVVQGRWFEKGLTNVQRTVLQSLHIYETVPGKNFGATLDLLISRDLAPEGAPTALLKDSGLIVAGSQYEAKVLEEYFGMRRLSNAEFLIQHVLTR